MADQTEVMIVKRSLAFLLPLLTMPFAPLPASAKDPIVSIEITGTSLAAPIKITDPAVVSAFSIWIGPGVRVNGRPVHLDPDNTAGMFIDWPKGMAGERPADRRNMSSIVHGVEGNWFHSSSAWEELVRPLVEKASAGRGG